LPNAQALGKENTRLQNQFKTQEGDREFLIKQLVAVKKDNARLREELSTAAAAAAAANKEGEPGSPHHHHSPSHHRGGQGSEAAGDADSRYKEIVKRLKRLLEVERRNLRAVRSQYQRDLQVRWRAARVLHCFSGASLAACVALPLLAVRAY